MNLNTVIIPVNTLKNFFLSLSSLLLSPSLLFRTLFCPQFIHFDVNRTAAVQGFTALILFLLRLFSFAEWATNMSALLQLSFFILALTTNVNGSKVRERFGAMSSNDYPLRLANPYVSTRNLERILLIQNSRFHL